MQRARSSLAKSGLLRSAQKREGSDAGDVALELEVESAVFMTVFWVRLTGLRVRLRQLPQPFESRRDAHAD